MQLQAVFKTQRNKLEIGGASLAALQNSCCSSKQTKISAGLAVYVFLFSYVMWLNCKQYQILSKGLQFRPDTRPGQAKAGKSSTHAPNPKVPPSLLAIHLALALGWLPFAKIYTFYHVVVEFNVHDLKTTLSSCQVYDDSLP